MTTIWTIPGMALAERLRRTRDTAALAVAHRLPRRLAYWSLVDSGVRHMGGPTRPTEVIPDVPFMDVLERAGQGVDLS